MLRKLGIRLATWILKRERFSLEETALFTSFILDKMGALPFRDIITTNEEGILLVRGRSLDIETARLLRDGARGFLDSPVRRFIYDQVLYEAVTLGVHKAEDAKQLVFSRAAIWFGQQEENLARLLAGDATEREPTP